MHSEPLQHGISHGLTRVSVVYLYDCVHTNVLHVHVCLSHLCTYMIIIYKH